MDNYKITGTLANTKIPNWPPKIGSIVIIEHTEHNNNLFIGSVYKLIWNDNAAIILLFNNRDHTEVVLEQRNEVPVGKSKGLFLLLSSFRWNYVKMSKLESVLNGDTTLESYMNTEILYEDVAKKKRKKVYRDDSLLNKSGELKMDELFADKKMILFKPNSSFEKTPDDIKTLLLNKLNKYEAIKESKAEIVVNSNISEINLISNKKDEESEGQKIIMWIQNNILNKTRKSNLNLFINLNLSIFNGYVHLTRTGLPPDDVITTELVGDLEYFNWQYDIPIDYTTLKDKLFQNPFQITLPQNIEEQKEAEKIFAQEFLIALQPEPQFQMWALKRLLIAWYGDNELTANIRKIKVIINQWRCRSDQSFNKKNGTMPSIVIYPRYGKESARIVIKKLINYFGLYNYISWNVAIPSYFIKVSDLIWYTNGDIDLKMYFRKTLEAYEGKVENKTFTDNFTSTKSTALLIAPF